MQIKPAANYGSGLKPAPSLREKILRLEAEVSQMPQVDCPVRNHFAHGVYLREMTIPAGTCATGAIHKTEHLTIIARGRLHLMTDDGVKEVVAGDVIKSSAGIKRVAFALEDTVLITIHPNPDNVQDEAQLVELLTESTLNELLGGAKNLQLAANKVKELT